MSPTDDPDERAGRTWTEEPGPDPTVWYFDRCEGDDTDEAAAAEGRRRNDCEGCTGWGQECWSVWRRRPRA